MIKRKNAVWSGVLFWALLFALLLFAFFDAKAQNRIRDKATEASLTGTELLGIDRADYGPIKKVSTLAFKNYVIDGLSIHNNTIAGINTSGWLEGQVLKFNASGILVPSNDATGGAGGGAEYFNDLLDVNTSGIVTNQVMKYNGTTHVPWTINLESVRQLGNTFSGDVFFSDSYFDGYTELNGVVSITTGAANGKILTSDADGNATWQDPAASVLQAGNGIRLDAGGSPGQVEVNFYPYTLPIITDPIASNINFAIDYAGDERKISFQNINTLMLQDQVFMSMYPEESVVIVDDISTLDLCVITVTLEDGEGSTIPIIGADQSDFAMDGNYCTPYFDDIENNEFRFCVYQFTTLPAGEEYSVTVTHTPSGAHQTWHLQIWGGPGGGGGSSSGLDEDDLVTMLPDGGIGTVKIEDAAINELKIADNAVTTDKIEDRSVSAAKIVPESITDEQFANGAITLSKADTSITHKLVYFVDSWPTTQTEGLYFKMGEGLRYYYINKGTCTFGYQSFDGQSGACLELK